MKRLLVACSAGFVAACLTAAVAPAASQTLLVSPAAPVLGGSVVFTGCGWTSTNPAGTRNLAVVYVHVPNGGVSQVKATVDKSGCFTTSGAFLDSSTSLPGNYQVTQAGDYWVEVAQGGAGKTHQADLFFSVV